MSSILDRAFRRGRYRVSAGRSRLHRGRKLKHSLSRQCKGSAKSKKESVRVKEFIQWCAQVGLELHPNVSIQQEGSCDGLGVVAKDAIHKGECIALIPRSCLLSCANSNVRDLVLEDTKLLEGCTSGWIPLLLALAAEYSCKASSKWYPYLSLVPSKPSALPMLWAESVRQPLLEGTGIECWVSNDLQRIEQDYGALVKPFLEKHNLVLPDFGAYKELVAYVMSYSFTDEEAGLLGTTMMVPFVDLLNHSSHHHGELTFHPKCLKLMAVRNIAKGAEVMNTYGSLSNASLLHTHGFVERDNPYDEAVILSQLIRDVYLRHYPYPKHWDTLCGLGVVEEDYAVSADGRVDQGLLTLTRLLCQKKKALRERMQPASLQDCSTEELLFLSRVAEQCLNAYPEQVSDQDPAASSSSSSSLKERRCWQVSDQDPAASSSSSSSSLKERQCWHVVLGQQNALRKLYTTAKS